MNLDPDIVLARTFSSPLKNICCQIDSKSLQKIFKYWTYFLKFLLIFDKLAMLRIDGSLFFRITDPYRDSGRQLFTGSGTLKKNQELLGALLYCPMFRKRIRNSRRTRRRGSSGIKKSGTSIGAVLYSKLLCPVFRKRTRNSRRTRRRGSSVRRRSSDRTESWRRRGGGSTWSEQTKVKIKGQ